MQEAVNHLKSADPVLAALIERVGAPRIQYRAPTFEILVRSIAFQQLNGKAASTIYNRLVEAAGGKITPASILKLRPPRMRACGLSRQKLSYIRDLARQTRAGQVDFARLPQMPDHEVIAHLTRVKGIGEWSAHMFLLFALRRPDVLPTGDFGVRNAIRQLYRKRSLPTPRQVERIAQSWHPYCSLAAWYLWRSVDVTT
jgi:DNA-3-methyladenine glycosylase II